MIFTSTVNFIFGAGTVFVQIAVVFLAAAWLFSLTVPDSLRRWTLHAAFAAAALSVLGGLIYSEIIGYAPCKLCWIQRIFMYPTALLLGMALWGRHKGSPALIDASFILTIIGGAVALYQYFLQLGVVPEGLCAALGSSVSCAERFVMEFGYITIPLMALSSFLLIILLLRLARQGAH